MRARLLATENNGKRFLALGWIDKWSRRRQNCGQAKDAARTGLLIRIRVRRVMVAAVSRHLGFHFGTATRLLYLPNRSLRRDHRESDRARNKEANQKSQRRSHPGFRYSFSPADSIFVFDFSARLGKLAAFASNRGAKNKPRHPASALV